MVLRPRLRPLLPTILLPHQLAAGAGGRTATISIIYEYLIIQGREYELLTSAVAVADLSRSLSIIYNLPNLPNMYLPPYPYLSLSPVSASSP